MTHRRLVRACRSRLLGPTTSPQALNRAPPTLRPRRQIRMFAVSCRAHGYVAMQGYADTRTLISRWLSLPMTALA
jgi:hypothetical protein